MHPAMRPRDSTSPTLEQLILQTISERSTAQPWFTWFNWDNILLSKRFRSTPYMIFLQTHWSEIYMYVSNIFSVIQAFIFPYNEPRDMWARMISFILKVTGWVGIEPSFRQNLVKIKLGWIANICIIRHIYQTLLFNHDIKARSAVTTPWMWCLVEWGGGLGWGWKVLVCRHPAVVSLSSIHHGGWPIYTYALENWSALVKGTPYHPVGTQSSNLNRLLYCSVDPKDQFTSIVIVKIAFQNIHFISASVG